MNRIVVLFGALLVLACASGGAGKVAACEPVPPEFARAGVVYRDCAVSQKAAVTEHVKVDYQALPRPTGTSGCMSAEFDMVVDTAGRPIPGTAKLARTNNQAYATEVGRLLETVRYSPAKKDGQLVQQLVRYKSEAAFMVTVVAAPAGSMPGRPSGARSNRPPSC
jgi:hypothetical protein